MRLAIVSTCAMVVAAMLMGCAAPRSQRHGPWYTVDNTTTARMLFHRSGEQRTINDFRQACIHAMREGGWTVHPGNNHLSIEAWCPPQPERFVTGTDGYATGSGVVLIEEAPSDCIRVFVWVSSEHDSVLKPDGLVRCLQNTGASFFEPVPETALSTRTP